MGTITKRLAAAAELLLVGPGVVFIAALFFRSIQSRDLEPAHTANRIVMWYVGLGPSIGLWGLLVALPLAGFGLGVVTLMQLWGADAELRRAADQTLSALRDHIATTLVASTTLVAAGVLSIVVFHMLTN